MNRFIPLSAVALSAAMLMPLSAQAAVNDPTSIPTGESAVRVLSTLAVADQTDKSSDRKDHDWANAADGRHAAYNTRDLVLDRDLSGTTHKANGRVATGTLDPEPYTGGTVHFVQGKANKAEGGSASATDGGIQIDHVVAYAEAYNSGLKDRTEEQRDAYYTDPDVLLAVQAQANNAKKDADAAGWMPSWDAFRCDYAALQIGIKAKYSLTVDQKEHDALASTLAQCPTQKVVSTSQVKSLAADLKSSGSTGDGQSETYSVEDLKSIRFTATPRKGDYRSDELDFDADTAVSVDGSSLPEGWKVIQTAVNGPFTPSMGGYRTSLAVYDSTADVTAPDGATVKSYRLHSTPFLDTAMTVAGAAVSDSKAVIPQADFDKLSSSDLAVTGAPSIEGVTAEPSVTANADGTKTAQILFVRNDVVIWNLTATVSAEAPKYSADDLKGLAFTVDGKPWDGNDLADPSALTWSGLPDGWTVADSTKDGIRTLAFTAPDGTVVRTVRVGTPHDAGKPKTDGTTDKASDTVASEPLASTGVGAMGALALFATLVLAAGAGLALASHGRD
jgi:hypothetical protein